MQFTVMSGTVKDTDYIFRIDLQRQLKAILVGNSMQTSIISTKHDIVYLFITNTHGDISGFHCSQIPRF